MYSKRLFFYFVPNISSQPISENNKNLLYILIIYCINETTRFYHPKQSKGRKSVYNNILNEKHNKVIFIML